MFQKTLEKKIRKNHSHIMVKSLYRHKKIQTYDVYF